MINQRTWPNNKRCHMKSAQSYLLFVHMTLLLIRYIDVYISWNIIWILFSKVAKIMEGDSDVQFIDIVWIHTTAVIYMFSQSYVFLQLSLSIKKYIVETYGGFLNIVWSIPTPLIETTATTTIVGSYMFMTWTLFFKQIVKFDMPPLVLQLLYRMVQQKSHGESHYITLINSYQLNAFMTQWHDYGVFAFVVVALWVDDIGKRKLNCDGCR